MPRPLTCLCAALLLTLPALAHAAGGGPDAFGYTWIDSNSPAGPSYSWTPSGSEVEPPDNGAVVVTMPFSFTLYGTAYSTVYVGDDGLLTFGGGSPGPSNTCLPLGSVATAAPFWDTWDSEEGTIRTQTTGAAPNRVFVVSWDDVEHNNANNGRRATFQVKLFEGTTALEFHYEDATLGGSPNAGGTATVGISDPTEGSTQISCNTQSLSDSYTVRFEVTCFDGDSDGFWDCVDDCDDTDPSVHPGAPEICDDGIDQGCSGADLVPDHDTDGYVSTACGGTDCNDANSLVHPGLYDGCDGVDTNCSGSIDDGDLDSDGWSACLDCLEANPAVNPSATEICGDGIDQDCSGADTPVDGDSDGYASLACGGPDCDDANPGVNPVAYDVCDGIDQDCTGVDGDGDLDADGFTACADCADANPAVYPGAAEICGDGIDQDCSGSDLSTDADSDGFVATSCGGTDCDDGSPATSPGAIEFCDGEDNDCDGFVDEAPAACGDDDDATADDDDSSVDDDDSSVDDDDSATDDDDSATDDDDATGDDDDSATDDDDAAIDDDDAATDDDDAAVVPDDDDTPGSQALTGGEGCSCGSSVAAGGASTAPFLGLLLLALGLRRRR